MPKINLASWIDCTEVEGPGKRFALWVQGCQRRCPGCCNPQFLDFEPKNIIDDTEISEMIKKSANENGIEGVTFLGGEPFLQAKGLFEVAKYCRTLGLSVMTFTGYILADLFVNRIPFAEELLQYTDVLVDGYFDEKNPEMIRNWVGSTNQRFHFLTDFYKSGIEYDECFSHGFELRIKPDGTLTSNGFPIESL
jgi:anaerobic ribonucleoside-triphosphate reductase activating protein